MNPEPARFWQKIHRHDLLAMILLLVTSLVAYATLVMPLSLRPASLPLREGQVSPQDLLAPTNVEYISSVRTNQARDLAERAVLPIFTEPDPGIARRQISRLRASLETISSVRADGTLAFEQKQATLTHLADLNLDPKTVNLILAMTDMRWDAIQQDALRVLEQIVRSPVREDNIKNVRQGVRSAVSFVLNDDQSAIVVALVTPFIVPNSFFSPELTDAARLQARQAVEPVTQTYLAGETVVARGRVLTSANIEALETLGLVRQSNLIYEYIGTGAMVIVLMTMVGMYFMRRHPGFYNEGRSLLLICILFILFLASARLIIPNRAILPYVFPIPAFGLLIATLFGTGGAIVLSIVICILAAFNLTNSLDLTLFYMLASLTGVLSLGKAHRISSFAWAAIVSALVGTAVITAYRLPAGDLDWVGYLTLAGASLLNGVASASLALMLQYLLAEFLGLTTGLRLLEISRPDAPLLQYFLRNAPGTYQHSLMVSNLVEQAAEKLGMDTLLVRVGALYHDVGKATNPSFFIENQLPNNLNPHDDVDAETAAASVIRHVTDGVILARKYRLPSRITDFMLEHHGTLLARYQYGRAVRDAGGDPVSVDESKFRYPGPQPRSRETALLMLADNVEARTRAEKARSEEEIRVVVQKAIDFCQKEGQLANTRFTLRDLTVISEVFVTTLTGLYHPRIAYPVAEASAQVEPPTVPVLGKQETK
ncbi:MAG TPA: HDIG domain-containing protein [Anaerolineales bacterium]